MASSKRPTQIPRWAWGAAATLVQPPSGSAETGFATRDEPPAQWINWQFNATGAWIDFLRGPDVEKWTRAQWPGTPATDHFDAPSALAFDVDTVTSDIGATDGAFRMAVVGETNAPAAKMFVSQTGLQWEERTNLPVSGTVTGPFALKALSTGRWLLGCASSVGAPLIYYAAADDGAAVGPLGANGNAWTLATLPAGLDEVKRFAELGGAAKLCAATATTGVYSADNGATWVDCTFTTTPANNGLDVVSDGVKYIWISQDAEVYVSTDGVTFAATVTLAAGSGAWRLCAGATGEVLAYRLGSTTVVDVYRSEDSGSSWTAITPAAASPTRITQVSHRDGVWLATVTRSPWVWASNDLTSWRALGVPVDTSTSPAALYNVRFDGGAWVVVGNGYALTCGRAADPATGAYVRDDAPSTLSDAGSLRGRLLSTTAPTDGQTLVWVNSTSRWTPSTAATGLPSASGADEFPLSTAAGATYTARTAAQVRAVLNRRAVTNMTTGAGWTPSTTGDATSVFGSSKLALAIGGTVNPSVAQVVNANALPDAFDVDLVVRLDVVNNDGGAAADGQFLVRIGNGTNWVALVTRSDGSYEVNSSAGGAALASGSSGISSGDRTGGNLWLMVSRRRTALLFSYAVSATTPPLPSEWTLLAVVTNLAALNLARGTWSLLAAYVAATIAYGIDITAIRASAADGGEL